MTAQMESHKKNRKYLSELTVIMTIMHIKAHAGHTKINHQKNEKIMLFE